jgi:CheY-like chemotaxis protein
MRVLLLDDQEWTTDKLQERLREAGAEVTYASTLEIALTELKDNKYDAIISDFDIDELSGKDFLRIVKGVYGESCETKVVEGGVTLEDIEEYDADIARVVDRHFDGDMIDYEDFVNEYGGAELVLFSATLYGDGVRDDCVLNDVRSFQKNNEVRDDYTAEESIVGYLGIGFD